VPIKQAAATANKIAEKLDADCRQYGAGADEAESALASAWRGKPVHGKLTHLVREVVASAVMLQEAVAPDTTVGRLQNEKKRLVEQFNKEKNHHEAAEKLSAVLRQKKNESAVVVPKSALHFFEARSLGLKQS
jgi:hypothetical protein